MDPDANLNEQLVLASRLVWQTDNDKPVSNDDVARLAELVIALDDWLSTHGFLPARWAQAARDDT